jgi:hypothetical protein
MVSILNETSAKRFLERLRSIPPDRVALWGTMSTPQMIGHLDTSLRYSRGELPPAPFVGGFKTQYVYGPLILNGIIRIPRGVKLPRRGKTPAKPLAEGTIDQVETSLKAFLESVGEPDFRPLHHPFFGNFGAKGWGKFHVVHFDHHLRQFGA